MIDIPPGASFEIQTEWVSSDIRELYEHFQAKIAEANEVPAHLLGAGPDIIGVFRQALATQTAHMQKRAENLLTYGTRPCIVVTKENKHERIGALD